jgi:hypothetical protein
MAVQAAEKTNQKEASTKSRQRIAHPSKRPIKLHTTSWYVNAARSIGVARGSRNPD